MRLKSIILQTPELNNLKPFQSLHNKVHEQYTKKVWKTSEKITSKNLVLLMSSCRQIFDSILA